MKVYIERLNITKDVEANNVKELLVKLDINPTTVIVTRDDKLIYDEAELNSDDEIKLLSVISGG